MEPNVVLPLASSLLSFLVFVLLVDQWRERRRPYQLIWAIGMLWYGLSAGTEFWGSAFGWSEPLYRAWYLIGAVWVAGWLGLGTMYLLGKTRFGYGAAFSILLAGLFTFLTWRRYDYPDSGITPYLYTAIALVGAVWIAVETYRAKDRWAHVAGVLIVGGSVVAIPLVLLAPLAAPGFAVDPATGIPTGDLFPGYVRLLTPFFNVTGGFALAFGALYSAYVFMPKKRVIRYSLDRRQGIDRYLVNLAIAPLAITVNLLASIPGAFVDLIRGRLNTRVPATILIAIGGFVPSLTSGLSRFGETTTFFLGEFLGAAFITAGFLVSIEVFKEFRVPFTQRVLHARRTT
ncbi:MAG TPA: hypothetical protein VLA23_03325, partial [Candidatus Limnocylindrales bacterium]|nr:hypothetical protein [Candidatus Limnocylindrales bacterium]